MIDIDNEVWDIETKKYGGKLEIVNGFKLYRIYAKHDLSSVEKGNRGGLIERIENLSKYGDCWVYDNAKVIEYATVRGDAAILNSATVKGHSVVKNNATVSHNAIVNDDAIIKDHSKISGEAYVGGYALVAGYSMITDLAQVTSNSVIRGNSIIKDTAIISDSAEITDSAVIKDKSIVIGSTVVKGSAIITGDSELDCNIISCNVDSCKILTDISLYENDYPIGDINSRYDYISLKLNFVQDCDVKASTICVNLNKNMFYIRGLGDRVPADLKDIDDIRLSRYFTINEDEFKIIKSYINSMKMIKESIDYRIKANINMDDGYNPVKEVVILNDNDDDDINAEVPF